MQGAANGTDQRLDILIAEIRALRLDIQTLTQAVQQQQQKPARKRNDRNVQPEHDSRTVEITGD